MTPSAPAFAIARTWAGLDTPKSVHNADFRRKAATACRYHGWDPRIFI